MKYIHRYNQKLWRMGYKAVAQRKVDTPSIKDIENPPGLKKYREWAKPQPNYQQGMEGAPKNHRLPKNKPWYLLSKTELVTIDNKRPSMKLSHKDYFNSYKNDKMAKWLLHNPEPKKDLFFEEFFERWTIAKAEAEKSIIEALNDRYEAYTISIMNNGKKHENVAKIKLREKINNAAIPMSTRVSHKLTRIINMHPQFNNIGALHISDKSQLLRVIPVTRKRTLIALSYKNSPILWGLVPHMPS